MQAPIVPPGLSGRRFSLRPLLPEMHRSLYELSIGEQINFRWRFHGTIPHFEVYERTLYQNVLVQFVIVPTKQPSALVGHVVAYDANLQDGTCYLGVISDHRIGAGVFEAIALFFRYLFAHWQFRKVYLQVPEFNLHQFASATELGLLREEARFREHQFFDDKFWDHIVLSVCREDAYQFRDSHPNIFGEPTEADPISAG